MRIAFDGTGRSRKVCDPNASCKSAVITASWHREWIVDLASGSRRPPEIIDYYTDLASWKDRAPCDAAYRGTAREAELAPGPTDSGGLLLIRTSVPLTEGSGGQSGGPNPLGKPPSCIGVGISGPGGPVPKAIEDILIATAKFGPYSAWTSGGAGAHSQVVSDSYQGLSGAGATNGQGTWDWVGALSVCTGGCVKNQDPAPELIAWTRLAAYALAKFGNLKAIPALIPPAGVTLDGQVSVEPTRTTSSAMGQVASAVPLATIHQRFARKNPTLLKPVFTTKGRQILASLKRSATFLAHITLTPSKENPIKESFSFKLLPVPPDRSTSAPPTPAAGAITSVTFAGSPTNPSFVVHGTNLGTLPEPDPPGHPSGHNGCPTITGDKGYDYGTSLYLTVLAKNWTGGRHTPTETDCIDLVVTKFTPTEVDFHLGQPYSSFYPKFSLDDGDQVQVAVNGTTKTVRVKYGATVTG